MYVANPFYAPRLSLVLCRLFPPAVRSPAGPPFSAEPHEDRKEKTESGFYLLRHKRILYHPKKRAGLLSSSLLFFLPAHDVEDRRRETHAAPERTDQGTAKSLKSSDGERPVYLQHTAPSTYTDRHAVRTCTDDSSLRVDRQTRVGFGQRLFSITREGGSSPLELRAEKMLRGKRFLVWSKEGEEDSGHLLPVRWVFELEDKKEGYEDATSLPGFAPDKKTPEKLPHFIIHGIHIHAHAYPSTVQRDVYTPGLF